MALFLTTHMVTIHFLLTIYSSISCSNPTAPAAKASEIIIVSDNLPAPCPDSRYLANLIEETAPGSTAVLTAGIYDATVLLNDSLKMEAAYKDMLAPIATLKVSDPETYWFIVSWLNTAYRTPNWDGYRNYETWRKRTLKRGIDCSGFARVMQDRIFGRKIRGGSQGILDTQCKRVPKSELVYGDLVFFRAPRARNNRIVHVGVYLMDGWFVHATSTRSAAEGRGLMINSLAEENWAAEFVTGGKIMAH
ncbi:MAG: C40 family peptidase [Lewinellaceae bacterium]|nr:C40 family peptidase [Saprospiraceae bacterium]MCB9311921.1 C40 family peptidase [Lewinellaceae bacterium]HRW76060.1 NlpC/P60 family protein [Saprospiraceae bacterium]